MNEEETVNDKADLQEGSHLSKSTTISFSETNPLGKKRKHISLEEYYKKPRVSARPTEDEEELIGKEHDQDITCSNTSGNSGDIEEEIATETHEDMKKSLMMPEFDAEQCSDQQNNFQPKMSDDESNTLSWDDNDIEDIAEMQYFTFQNDRKREEFVTIENYNIDKPLMPLKPDHKLLIRLYSIYYCALQFPGWIEHFYCMCCKPCVNNYHRDKWDKDHVRMPCSKENQCPMPGKKIGSRWEIICKELLKPIRKSMDFEEAILTYNSHYRKKWNFDGWHGFCNHVLDEYERDDLYCNLLPAIAKLALRLPEICTNAIPFLRQQKNKQITMSQEQIACLLANAFFCTFPRRNSQKKSEYSSFPSINFNKLYRGVGDFVNNVIAEKLRCLLHYFSRITQKTPTGTLTFTRRVLHDKDIPIWTKFENRFCDLVVSSTGSIEDEGKGLLEVDFANRYIGGGVIGMGCVQEEIRFLICPEMIISRLFTESLEKNETLVIRGCERYSCYTGYAQTFKWNGDYDDCTPRDSWGRRLIEVVAMDAHIFHKYEDQFKLDRLDRELNKAYCGFYCSAPYHRQPPAIATGNWGCGAFGGTSNIKALVQLMAAAIYNRDMLYCTFGDKSFAKKLRRIHAFLIENEVTVGQLRRVLRAYERDIRSEIQHIELYPYLMETLVKKSPPRSTGEIDTIKVNKTQEEMKRDSEGLEET